MELKKGLDSIESHYKSLIQRHAELEKKIKEGYSNYLDDEHLGKIKHEKLLLKREIFKIEKQLQGSKHET
jgi:hypothetical protein